MWTLLAFWMSVSVWVIHLADSFLIWRLSWRILWTVRSESAGFEDISHVQIRGTVFTLSTPADTYFLVWDHLSATKRCDSFLLLSLSLEQDKSCHLLMVACKEALDHATFTKSLWIFSVPSPSFSCARTWKCSLRLLICSIFSQCVNDWFKWCHINKRHMTRVTYWLELLI